MKRLLFLTLCLLFASTMALGDWNVGDGHKMHYPQLPDPNGWGVDNTYPIFLADDWTCSNTGPVKDVHFWGAWQGDLVGTIEYIRLEIFSDDPNGGGPRTRLWHDNFYSDPGTDQMGFKVRKWGEGDQGWYHPGAMMYISHDHVNIWQYNFSIPEGSAFTQEKGKNYWLCIFAEIPDSNVYQFGWKTSISEHHGGDAVWDDPGETNWRTLTDLGGKPLDLAFVITPEPGTVLLLGFGGLAMFRRRRD